MKKTNKLWLALLLTVLVAALLAVGFTAAAEEPAIIDQGYCGAEGDGTNLIWVLTNDGTLTISGEGEMTLNSSMLSKHADEIQTVVIEEGATNIADDAFYDCRIMTGITIPDSVTSIGYEAFSGCWSLADITIPNTVTSIGDDAFEGCKSLTSIAIPESMTSISHSLFLSCISLTDITIPNSVTSIGTDAFRACRSLTEITIPDSVTSIGAYAFQNCDSLRSIVIPNGVTSIGRYTFFDCSGLIEITIPDSVTGIGNKAFDRCNSLADVYYTGSEELWNAITIEDWNTPLTEAAIHFNVADWGYCGGEGDGTNLTWVLTNDGTLTISGEGVMALFSSGASPWYNWSNSIRTILIEDGVMSISKSAFKKCTLLESVAIPDSVIGIGSSAFQNCTSLASATIPDGITDLNTNTFNNCTSLTSVSLPNSLKTIENKAFYNCTALENVTIPERVESIGEEAFMNCSSLKRVIIPDLVTSIGSLAFANCTSMTRMKMSNKVIMLPGFVFQNCTSLVSVTLGDRLSAIYEFAFHNCSSLKRVTISNVMSLIDHGVFQNCTSLETVYHYTGQLGLTSELELERWNEPFEYANHVYLYDHEHTAGEPVREYETAATCTTAGSYDEVVYCTECGNEISWETKQIDPLNHCNAQDVSATEATATEHGYTAGVYCPDCDTWLSGHDVIHNHLGAQTIIKEPTETEEGIVDIVCTVCGEHGQYTAAKTEPKPDDNGDSDNGGFWQRITSFAKGIIDWFLRLFKWLGR